MTLLEKILTELQDLNSKLEKIKSAEKGGFPRMMDGKANLSTTEAMELLGIGRNKLLELVHANAIPHIKNGSRYLFPVDQLFDWLSGRAAENYIKEDESEDIEKMFKTIS
ncbi:MAG: helix-turn-helix domain-containing protein [Halanaerobiales bacterium]|nr:helix-turn-helix domain-containing protein [Halanaerobiales bacterium]